MFLLFSVPAYAQKSMNYFSEADMQIRPQKVLILPVQDNTNEVYAKPLTEKLIQIVEAENQYAVSNWTSNAKFLNLSPDFLMEQPQVVKDILKQSQTDSMIATRVSLGTKGLQGKMTFFHGSEGLPLLSAEFRDLGVTTIKEVESQIVTLFQEMKSQMNFQGTISSRQGNQVTMNLGTYQGARDNDLISVIQFLKVQRHPRFQFMISADREVIGKIRITKAEEHLSFGQVILEKEPLLLSLGHKLSIDRMVKYSDVVKSKNQVLEDMNNRQDTNYVFGDQPKEWEPIQPPQFGRVQLIAGFGQYNQTAALRSAGSITATENFAPQVLVGGEMWFNKNYFLNLEFKQSQFSVDNPLKNSSPDKLNMSFGHYHIMGIYNLPFSDSFFGPRIQFMAGFHKFRSRSDESTPIAFTNMEYGGLAFGFLGAFPIDEKIDMGLQFKLFYNPTVSESSTNNSGSAKEPNLNLFSLFGSYRYKTNINFVGRFDLEYYSVDFGADGSRPDPTTSVNHRMTTLLGGIEYLF
ncbi:MAG: hypothetical protein ACK5P5_00270 [Pseudobdellovibrionaceae bacterium]